MAEKIRPVEQMLELSGDEAVSAEQLDSQVQKAQEQLLQLKRQQEQIEKHLFNRSNFFCHDKSRRRPRSPKRTLSG